MLDRLKQLFGRGSSTRSDSMKDTQYSAQSTSALQRAAEMDLAERDERINALEAELQRLTVSQHRLTDDSINSKLGKFFSEVAGPVSQLLTQIHLVDDQKQEVNARDTLRLVKRLVRQLEASGLEICAPAGDEVGFDPNLHEPLSSDFAPKAGDTVVIRIPGLAFGGRVIYKAGVKAEG